MSYSTLLAIAGDPAKIFRIGDFSSFGSESKNDAALSFVKPAPFLWREIYIAKLEWRVKRGDLVQNRLIRVPVHEPLSF